MICPWCNEPGTVDPCVACAQPTLLDGKWRLHAVIGTGAAGTTWRAQDAEGRPWAIKEMPLRLASAKARELVTREATVLRQLRHPGIPAYRDHFVAGTGRNRALYLVEEYVDGITLDEEMRRHRYDEDEVLGIMEQLLWILAYLHELSPPVVHRDLKLGNVMRRATGELVLVDFGSVREALVESFTFTGTFGYMAPEQLHGDACAASDLYGVGALAIALLTRREPRHLLDVRHQLRWEPFARVSPETARLISDLVEPDLARRVGSARAALARVTARRDAIRSRDVLAEIAPTVRRNRPGAPLLRTSRLPVPAPPSNVALAHPGVDLETVVFGVVMLVTNAAVILLLGLGTVLFVWQAS